MRDAPGRDRRQEAHAAAREAVGAQRERYRRFAGMLRDRLRAGAEHPDLLLDVSAAAEPALAAAQRAGDELRAHLAAAREDPDAERAARLEAEVEGLRGEMRGCQEVLSLVYEALERGRGATEQGIRALRQAPGGERAYAQAGRAKGTALSRRA